MAHLIHGRFLFWLMGSAPVRGQLGVAATGVIRYGLRTDSIDGATIPCPPIHHQVAITAYLDAETARIDALIAKKHRLLSVLDELASRRLNDPFSTEHFLNSDSVPIGVPGHQCVRLGLLARVQTRYRPVLRLMHRGT